MCIIGAAMTFVMGCAGGMPKVPDSSDELLAKADAYYQSDRYYGASELYKAFVSSYPGHDRSDYAQFMMAESYYGDRDLSLAAVEYTVLMSNYGYSEYVDDALFKIGVCYYEQSPKSTRDQQMTMDALSRFDQFVQTFPNSPLMGDAEEYTVKINKKLAHKAIDNAQFYYRRKRMRASMIYLKKVIDNYPDNEYWVEAAYRAGLIQYDIGNDEEAIRYLSLVLSYPDDYGYKSEARGILERLRD